VHPRPEDKHNHVGIYVREGIEYRFLRVFVSVASFGVRAATQSTRHPRSQDYMHPRVLECAPPDSSRNLHIGCVMIYDRPLNYTHRLVL